MTCPDCEKLKAELAEWLGMAMRSECIVEMDGKFAGWHDPMAMSSGLEIGDRLVELGLWERHPNGKGRRQFYRPKEQP